MNPILLIPARLASTRLPAKPLALIGGVPMIVRVLRQAEAAGLGPAAVAAGEAEIVTAVENAGGRAVLTDPGLPSGSDRIFDGRHDLGFARRHRRGAQARRFGLAQHPHDHRHPPDVGQGLGRQPGRGQAAGISRIGFIALSRCGRRPGEAAGF